MDCSLKPKKGYTQFCRNLAKSIKTGPLFIVALMSIVLTGCYGTDGADQKYFKSFKHIETDQFVWSYARGGIYWVSDSAVVLDAQVKTSEGQVERGIYQVNMDGTYVRLVDTDNQGQFDYCYDGKTLFLRNKTGQFDILQKPVGYSLRTETNWQFIKGYTYGSVRCHFVKIPVRDAGYKALSEEDGFIKNTYKSEELPNPPVFVADNDGNPVAKLGVGANNIFGDPRYFPDRNVYFFSRIYAQRAKLWWLYRDNWKVDYKELRLGNWASHGSNIALSTRAGLFIENHSPTNKFKSYLVTDDKEYPLEMVSSRRAVLAPDGCRVAYGSGNYRARNRGPHDNRQVLKVFNACKFMEDKQ